MSEKNRPAARHSEEYLVFPCIEQHRTDALLRINDACIEHVGNNFPSLPKSLSEHFERYQKAFLVVMEQTELLLSRQPLTYEDAAALRAKIEHEQHVFEQYQKQIIQLIQHHDTNIPAATVYLSLIQESQLLMSNLRHILRGMAKFTS